jgi:hypothetical protein
MAFYGVHLGPGNSCWSSPTRTINGTTRSFSNTLAPSAACYGKGREWNRFVRLVAATFDAYLPAGKARHSVAV